MASKTKNEDADKKKAALEEIRRATQKRKQPEPPACATASQNSASDEATILARMQDIQNTPSLVIKPVEAKPKPTIDLTDWEAEMSMETVEDINPHSSLSSQHKHKKSKKSHHQSSPFPQDCLPLEKTDFDRLIDQALHLTLTNFMRLDAEELRKVDLSALETIQV